MPVSPDYAAGLAKTLLDIYTDAEERLLRKIAHRLAVGIDEPSWADRQLLSVQRLRNDTLQLITDLQAKGAAAVTDTILTAYNRGVALAGADLAATGTPTAISFGGVDTRAMMTLVDEARSSLGAMSLPIQSAQTAIYRDVVRDTATRMLSGTMTRREAAADAMQSWADKGVTGFTDKAGRKWSMSTYAEMVARTSAGQAMVAGHVDRLADTGHDLVMVSDAPEECSLCRPWEGKVLSIAGRTSVGPQSIEGHRFTVAGTLSQAVSAGLHHQNCRHRLVAYQPGVTRPLLDTADPEGDKLRQQQRYRERRVRELKRRALVAEELHGKTSPLAKAARAKTTAYSRDFAGWREANGRKNLSARTSVSTPTANPNTSPAPSRPVFDPNVYRTAATPSDVGRLLQEQLGTRGKVTGFDATRLDLDRVRQLGETLGQLYDKYPHVNAGITVLPIKNAGVFAQAGRKVLRNERGDRVLRENKTETWVDMDIQVAVGKLRKGSKVDAMFDRSVETGHVHVAKSSGDVAPMQYIVTHEFGHILDFHKDNSLGGVGINAGSIRVNQMTTDGIEKSFSKEAYEWTKVNQSVYARSNTRELVAEAFADVEINKDGAFPLSKVIHKALTAPDPKVDR